MILSKSNIKSVKSSFTHLGDFICDNLCDNLWDHVHTIVWIKLTNQIGERLFHHIGYRIELTV
jgi:hypothetical protein